MAEIVKLGIEYNIGGKTVNQIVLNLEELTGNDLILAEKEYKLRTKGVAVKELEDGWLLTVAAKASGFKYGDLLKLKGKDFLTVLNKTRGFLNTGLVSEEDTENTETEEMEAQEEETVAEE